MSQQRVHAHDASLPSTGSARAIVPPLPRYYQGTATSCRPSRRASFPSFGGTTGSRTFRSRRRCVLPRRAWGWSPGIPLRDASVETSGSLKFLGNPYSRLLMFSDPGRPMRPRPVTERSRGPRCLNDEDADDYIPFEAR